jgi:dihydroxy-acid dehydratase
LTVNGKSIKENAGSAEVFNADVIRPVTAPLTANGGIAVLRGNLAPNGAVLKPSAATAELMQHTGRAVVFDSIDDFHARVDDPTLEIDASSIMVLRNCGPCGYPGMAEVGNMPLPAKLLARGVRDMVRISDARMSGTAYGTVVLHVAPEAATGGPLALVRTGDWIHLDVPARSLTLEVTDEEMASRRAGWQPPEPHASRGWTRLYGEHVLQADSGADLDFLVGASGHEVPRDSH